MDKRQELQSLKRGLRAIAMINTLGSITIAELARRYRLPRTSAERILVTLLNEGYLERDLVTKAFFLTHQVHALSDGYMVDSRIVALSRPIMEQATREVGWPFQLTTPLGEHMSVRFTTDPHTTLNIQRRYIGRAVPMATSGSGIIFLASLDDTQQPVMLQMLRRSENPLQAVVQDEARMAFALSEARRDGYSFGLNFGRERSVAVPIRVAGHFKAALLMTFMSRVLTNEAVIEQFVPRLKAMADQIERAVADTLVEHR